MKQVLILILLSTTSLFAEDFSKIEVIVSKYRNISSPEDLAEKINQNFSTDADKLKASFYWLATNINYDIASLNSSKKQYHFKYTDEADKQRKIKAIQNKFIDETFLKRQGVCEEYALALKKLCDLLHIPCKVINGNVRVDASEIGRIEHGSNHAWNLVFINKKWIFVDATWAAGYGMNGKWNKSFNPFFYNTAKHKIVKTHFSNSLIWNKFFKQPNQKTFYNQPIYKLHFLKTEAEIIAPKSGIIRRNNTNQIILYLKNLDSTIQIDYVYNRQKYAEKPIIIKNGTVTKLIFETPLKTSFLNIFFNKKLALQYKVL